MNVSSIEPKGGTVATVKPEKKPQAEVKNGKKKIVADESVAEHLALIFKTAKRGLKIAGLKPNAENMHVAAEEVAKMLRHLAPHTGANRTPAAAA
jgi:hypothetical protein